MGKRRVLGEPQEDWSFEVETPLGGGGEKQLAAKKKRAPKRGVPGPLRFLEGQKGQQQKRRALRKKAGKNGDRRRFLRAQQGDSYPSTHSMKKGPAQKKGQKGPAATDDSANPYVLYPHVTPAHPMGIPPPPGDHQPVWLSYFSREAEQEPPLLYPFYKPDLEIGRLVCQIRDKPDWEQKVTKAAIVNKWKAEVPEEVVWALKYAVDFLKHDLTIHSPADQGPVSLFGFGVHKAFDVVPGEVLQELKEGALRLEGEKGEDDWHPGSHRQVLDLVHPSLFPVVYGHSMAGRGAEWEVEGVWSDKVGIVHSYPATPWGGAALGPGLIDLDGIFRRVEPNPYQREARPSFQWLPAEVGVGEDYGCTFLSYINNLHPVQHKPLYSTIEKVLERFVPMFELTLGLKRPDLMENKKVLGFWEIGSTAPHNVVAEPGAYVDYESKYDPEECHCREATPIYSLRGRKMKVIVKMANIHLSPEDPVYKGGSWHVEGEKHERIAATGIYYYDSENVTDAKLEFRKAFEIEHDNISERMDHIDEERYLEEYGNDPEPLGYDKDGLHFQEALTGMRFGEPQIQSLGGISTPQGKAICFPNHLHHQLQPFELVDKSREGHRKILVFFLIDPEMDKLVLSSLRVAPQQREWWMEYARREWDLPRDLMQVVFDYFPGAFSWEQAVKNRQELMSERSVQAQRIRFPHLEEPTGLCEH